MAQKLISKKTYYTTEDYIRDTERNIQRDEIRSMIEPAKAPELRKRIEGEKRLLIALRKLFGNRGRIETSAFTDADSFEKKHI